MGVVRDGAFEASVASVAREEVSRGEKCVKNDCMKCVLE